MHLNHLLAATLLALLSGSAASQGLPLPDLNTGNLGLRDFPQNKGSMPMESQTPSSSEYQYQTPTSSASVMPTSSMPSTSPTSTMATSTRPYSSPSTTPSTLQYSLKSSSSMGRSSPLSSSAYPSSSPVSGSNNLLGGLLGDKGLQLRAEPTVVGGLPGVVQPVYQPAARPT